MTVRYTYSIQSSALVMFLASKTLERDELLKLFEFLAKNPATGGDATATGPSGRPLEMKQFGRWIITYWADHGSKDVRITALKRLK
jgi:hypothetical protein